MDVKGPPPTVLPESRGAIVSTVSIVGARRKFLSCFCLYADGLADSGEIDRLPIVSRSTIHEVRPGAWVMAQGPGFGSSPNIGTSMRRKRRVGARQKLNTAYLNGSLLIAAAVGLTMQSGAAFLLTLAIMVSL